MTLKNRIIAATLGLFMSHATDGQKQVLPFPKDFWWGTSLSSHQSEGNNVNSWTEWEKQPGHIKNNEQSGLAADHWNRFEEDFEHLKWLGANTHRLSVEWARLEPSPGVWDKTAARHYREMIMSLRKKGIRPVICLFHFTLPLWVAREGGFENPKMVDAFVEFSEHVQKEFGDIVEDWLTMNEPVVYALAAYAGGLTPPGVKDFKRTMTVIVNLLKAHGRVYHVIKHLNPRSQIGFAQHLRIFAPKNRFNPFDRWGAQVAAEVLNWSWYKTIKTGKIRINVPTIFQADEEAPDCLGAMDFLGFNYYGRDFVSVNLFSKERFHLTTSPQAEKTDMNWDIYPEGLREILEGIEAHGLGQYPLLITENGIADKSDKKRPAFIYNHLRVFLETSQELGLKPMGYLYWSLIDNFEWIDGFGPRFGLFEIDYETQQRKARPSAFYFREMSQKKVLFPP